MKKYQCTVCGYISDDDAPHPCPKCGAAKEKFEQLSEEQAKLVDQSRYTNLLHNDLIVTLEEVLDISMEGLEDNLDPGCHAIFEKARKTATELIQMSKAEIAGHIAKGKWG